MRFLRTSTADTKVCAENHCDSHFHTANLKYNEHKYSEFMAIMNSCSCPGKVLIYTYRKLLYITNTAITK